MNIAPAASVSSRAAASLRPDNTANNAADVNTQNSGPRRAARTETAASAGAAQQPRDAYEPSAEARATETRQRDLARDASAQRDAYDADRQPARTRTEATGGAIDLVG